MPLCYASEIHTRFRQLRSATIGVNGIHADANSGAQVAQLLAVADKRLAATREGEFAEIKAWRRAFSELGLKPTQYRCASESLLRRYRKNGELPTLHPLIDLCNAASLAFAIPVAAFDIDRISGALTVRSACGDELYETFSGETEHPEPGEVIFADDSGRAHARRWTHRQSGWSAVRQRTSNVLIVAEALHETAQDDVENLIVALTDAISQVWPAAIRTDIKRL